MERGSPVALSPVVAPVREQQAATAPTSATRGCWHQKAGASNRSAASLLHRSEQEPALVKSALSRLVRSSSQLRSAAQLRNACAGSSQGPGAQDPSRL